MNTVVVLVGLMLIVPRVDSSGHLKALTVLVLDVEDAKAPTGVKVSHVTQVQNLNGAFKDLSAEWALHSSTDKPIEIDDPCSRLLFLKTVFGAALPPLRKGCLEGDLAGCTLNGKSLLKARLTFTGGWRVSPIEINAVLQPIHRIKDDARWDFVAPEGQTVGMSLLLASGLRLTPLDAGSVTIDEPGSATRFTALASLPQFLCLPMVGVDSACSIVEFLNVIIHSPSDSPAPAKTGKAAGRRKASKPPIDPAVIDTHHDKLYDLLDPPPTPRYRLYLRQNSTKEILTALGYGTGGGTVGARPCSPGVFVDPVSFP